MWVRLWVKRENADKMNLPPYCRFHPLTHFFQKFMGSTRNAKLNFQGRKTAENGGFSKKIGPSDRIRTCGILLPKQARYQLRYTRLFSFSELPRVYPKQAPYQLGYTRKCKIAVQYILLSPVKIVKQILSKRAAPWDCPSLF